MRLFDGLVKVLDGGVHGLAAIDDLIDVQFLEDVDDAAAQRHADDAVGLLLRRFLGGELGHALAVFLEHVVDLDGVQFAQFQRVLQRLAGVVGVYMHLDHGEVGDDQHAVAQLLQALAQAHHVAVAHLRARVGDDELRAVAEGDLLKAVVVVHELAGHGGARALGGHVHLHRLAGEGGQHAAVDDGQAGAAGIDHARLLEHGQHVRRLFEDGFAAFEDGAEQLHDVRHLAAVALGVLGHDAGHGEDGALLGLHHGLVGGVRPGAQGADHQGAVDVLRAVQSAGKAAQDLAQNDAGVAARALERPAGHGGGHVADADGVFRLHLLDGGIDGLGHVRARIAIRYGEDVQRVHALPVLGEQRRAGLDHFLKQQPVYFCLRHDMQTSTSGMGGASDADVLHADVDATDVDAGQVFHFVFHGFDDGGGHSADGDAVFHDDEQVDIHLFAILAHLHAPAEVFPAHELHDAVRRALRGHAHDAVAIQRGVARHAHDHLVVDGDEAQLRLELAIHIPTSPEGSYSYPFY